MKVEHMLRSILFSLIYLCLFTLSRIFFPSYFQYLEHLVSLFLTFVFAIFYFQLRKSSILEYLATSVLLLISFNILTTLSMNIDRSRSVEVILLTKEAEKNNISFQKTLEANRVNNNELDAYIQRFKEQSQMKLLSGDIQKPKLSFLGRNFLKFSEFLAKVWKLEGFNKIGRK